MPCLRTEAATTTSGRRGTNWRVIPLPSRSHLRPHSVTSRPRPDTYLCTTTTFDQAAGNESAEVEVDRVLALGGFHIFPMRRRKVVPGYDAVKEGGGGKPTAWMVA